MTLAFHRAMKRWLLDVFSRAQTTPNEIARFFLNGMKRPCRKAEVKEFVRWVNNRKIERLVHFTPLQNVPMIMRHGLIPREYLELEVLQLALGARFTDRHRLEELPQYNCMSITSPNYGMFYAKRQSFGGGWAVLAIDPNVLARLYFAFTPTNAAAGVAPVDGVEGAEQLFLLRESRENLQLMPNEPTDPQAEALCDSIVTPDCITNVYVQRTDHVKWLQQQGIKAEVDDSLFGPRRDWQFWKGKRVTDLLGMFAIH